MRIQQNYPATNFKAQLEIFNAEPRLNPLVEQYKEDWKWQASRIGDDEDKLCLTITPHKTKYAINGSRETTIGVNLFSDFENLYEGSELKYPEEMKYISVDNLTNSLKYTIQNMFRGMSGGMEVRKHFQKKEQK